MVVLEPEHRALFAVDIERSADPRRHNAASVAMRRALREHLSSVFHAAGIDWSGCHDHDRGDGLVVAVPAHHPKRLLLHPVLEALDDALRAHNDRSPEPERMRVRVAVHDADVVLDDFGYTGRPLVLLARLLDAPPLREALASAPRAVTVAAIVSERFHEDVVAQGHPDIDPERYHRTEVRVKESRLVGWLHVPGRPAAVPAEGGWRVRAAVNHDRLFGVDAATARLREAIANPTGSWILAVRGSGGVGKTTIAFEAVDRAQREHLVDRVLWTTVRGDAPEDDEPDARAWWMEAVVDLADQLDVTLGPNPRQWGEAFRDALAGREPVVTVVDNVETVRQASALVARLHGIGLVRPHKLVVTSRSRVEDPNGLVQQHTVRGLSEDDSIALVRHIGRDDGQLATASRDLLLPVVGVTEGNPYLLKLVVGHYLSTGLPLSRVAAELSGPPGDGLGQRAKDHLFDRSLAELELVAGEANAQALITAFCVKRRGDEMAGEELRDICGLSAGVFDTTLRSALDLGLVQASRLNSRYSIHSLLHEYTRPR
ncbi:NB-ARC domain-containing protein [Actinosynnema sp. NPDC023587]|uniref:NB-ARC domain-containing protein n=1 Tax=Actinosynnema sp. NPDC023587 TaxID=3154695 RepID=UPI0033C9FC9F